MRCDDAAEELDRGIALDDDDGPNERRRVLLTAEPGRRPRGARASLTRRGLGTLGTLGLRMYPPVDRGRFLEITGTGLGSILVLESKMVMNLTHHQYTINRLLLDSVGQLLKF